MITLLIKGNLYDAACAAHKRGIELLSATQVFRETEARVSPSAHDAVQRWFCEDVGPAPFAPGALLFYSNAPNRERPTIGETRVTRVATDPITARVVAAVNKAELAEREAIADAAFKAEFGD